MVDLGRWIPFISARVDDAETDIPQPATGLTPIPTEVVVAVADEWPADFSRDDLEANLNAVQDYAIQAYGPTAYPGEDPADGTEPAVEHPIRELVHHEASTSPLEKLFYTSDDRGVDGYVVNGERWTAVKSELGMSQLALEAVQEAHRVYATDLGQGEYAQLLNPLFISTDNPPALEGEVADDADVAPADDGESTDASAAEATEAASADDDGSDDSLGGLVAGSDEDDNEGGVDPDVLAEESEFVFDDGGGEAVAPGTDGDDGTPGEGAGSVGDDAVDAGGGIGESGWQFDDVDAAATEPDGGTTVEVGVEVPGAPVGAAARGGAGGGVGGGFPAWMLASVKPQRSRRE
jgi:hypothetical protein